MPAIRNVFLAVQKQMVRTAFEKCIWVVVSVLTNLGGVPATWLLLRRGQIFEGLVGVFTISTSMMYHLCDSLELYGREGLWLGEGAWHRLDNVGSIMCFVVLANYFMDWDDRRKHDTFNCVMLYVVFLLQEKSPWDIRYTIAPIVFSVVFTAVKRVAFNGGFPRMNWSRLQRGMALQCLAFVFFGFGLNEKQDPYRVFHGLWHTVCGIASWHNWQAIAKPKFHLTEYMDLSSKIDTCV